MVIPSTNKHLDVCLVIVLFLGGCTFGCLGGGNKLEEAQIGQSKGVGRTQIAVTHPNWWQEHPPNDKEYIYGVGSSMESREKAESQARDSLIRQLGVYVEAKIKQINIDDNVGIARQYIEERVERYRRHLPPTKLMASRYENDTHFVLVSLSTAEIDRQGERDQAIVRDAYKAASYLYREGKILRSLQGYVNAWSKAKFLLEWSDYDYIDLNGKTKVRATDHMEEKLRHILGNIQLEAGGNGQSGYFGQELKQPLTVRSTVEGRPLAELPVLFYYHIEHFGHGEFGGIESSTQSSEMNSRHFRIQTNWKGQAECRIQKLVSIHPHNLVKAKIDLDSWLKQFVERSEGEQRLLQQIFAVANQKEVEFNYRTEFCRDRTSVLNLTFKGKAVPFIFSDGTVVDLSIEVPKKCVLHIFHINSRAEIRFKHAVEINAIQNVGNLVIQANPRGYVVHIKGIKLEKHVRGAEFEAFIAISCSRSIDFESDRPVEKEMIIKKFNATGSDWSIGEVGYQLK